MFAVNRAAQDRIEVVDRRSIAQRGGNDSRRARSRSSGSQLGAAGARPLRSARAGPAGRR